MSMSMFVIGIRPADDKHASYLKIARECVKLHIKLPEEVSKYFGGTPENDTSGLEVEIPSRKFHDESRQGFEVDVVEIPQGVKTIRFYCSW